jgi:hypothetical protein
MWYKDPRETFHLRSPSTPVQIVGYLIASYSVCGKLSMSIY